MSKAHAITLGAARFIPDLSGALYWAEEQMLLVADLHLEHGTSLARRGARVPPYDTAQTLAQLEAILAETAARRLVLLGDSFHAEDAHEHVEPVTRARLLDITSRFETTWITGNHDPVVHQDLGGQCVDELVLGALILRHVPGDIPEGSAEIAGHLHPGANVSHRGHSIHAKCFATDGRRLIMPAFGTYTGALSLRSKAFDGLFDEGAGHVLMLGRDALHRFQMKRVR